MQRFVVVVVVSMLSLIVPLGGCPQPVEPAEGEGEGGEGEGEGDAGEGEGEGNVGEGEGEGNVGEGEGDAGEGEGEGEGNVGEGEGEGQAGVDCARDDDCSSGDVCLFRSSGGFILDGVCGTSPAGAAPGAGCTAAGGECARDVCLSNQCTQLCVGAVDCPAGMACEQRSFTADDGTGGNAPICVADTTLADTPCARDADCAATGRLCNTLDESFALICGFPGGGSAFGGQCVSEFFENRTACQTGLCDGDVAGMCTRACVNNADCGGGLLCSGSPFSNVSGDYCAEPCATDEQCDSVAGRFCSPRDNAADNAIDTVCIPPPGNRGFGDNAASGLECTTNLQFQGRCTKLCNPAGGAGGGACAAPLPNCTSVNFPRPGGGDQPLNLCLP